MDEVLQAPSNFCHGLATRSPVTLWGKRALGLTQTLRQPSRGTERELKAQ